MRGVTRCLVSLPSSNATKDARKHQASGAARPRIRRPHTRAAPKVINLPLMSQSAVRLETDVPATVMIPIIQFEKFSAGAQSWPHAS